MYRRILIPLDGSSRAEEAIPHALCLASPGETEIHLLSVIPDIRDWTGFITYSPFHNQDLREIAERTRKQQEQSMRAYLDMTAWALEDAGQQVQIHIVIGQPAESIIHMAEALGVDLIVMSSHGRGGVSRWVHGSVAERVLRGSRRPVLVVPVREQNALTTAAPEGQVVAEMGNSRSDRPLR